MQISSLFCGLASRNLRRQCYDMTPVASQSLTLLNYIQIIFIKPLAKCFNDALRQRREAKTGYRIINMIIQSMGRTKLFGGYNISKWVPQVKSVARSQAPSWMPRFHIQFCNLNTRVVIKLLSYLIYNRKPCTYIYCVYYSQNNDCWCEEVTSDKSHSNDFYFRRYMYQILFKLNVIEIRSCNRTFGVILWG